jgi:hypothetical protein
VVEIWPRLLTGRVNKSDAVGRWAWLQYRFPEQDLQLLRRAAASEDAFDAAVSALVMDRLYRHRPALPEARDAQDRIEGRILRPLLDPLVVDAPFGSGWRQGPRPPAWQGPRAASATRPAVDDRPRQRAAPSSK